MQCVAVIIYVDFGDFVRRLLLSLVGFFSFIKCGSVKNFTLFGGQTIKIYRPLLVLPVQWLTPVQ